MKLSEVSGFNFSEYIGKGALLTASKADGTLNTMTVSWGTQGILWNKEVCTVFVRPQRYTFEFCESENATLTLSFFGKDRKDTLNFCGTKSGRDVNKIEVCNLKYSLKNGACVFEDAKITLVLKKLYDDNLKEDFFLDSNPLSNYKNGDFHRAYTCEIIDVIIK